MNFWERIVLKKPWQKPWLFVMGKSAGQTCAKNNLYLYAACDGHTPDRQERPFAVNLSRRIFSNDSADPFP